MDAEAKTDFFVSYNRYDKTWAEWIAWILEAAGYTVVIEAWDFRPRGNFVLYMQQAAAQAERTIAVLSAHYLDGKFTHPEWAAAFAQDPTGEKHLLIPIRVCECTLTGLWATIVYVDVVGVEEAAAQSLVLQAAQTGRTKPEQKPRFPGQAASMTDRAKPIYPPNIVQNLPYGSTNFVGRETELEQIHHQLQQRSTTIVLAISGMGGTGKTELALQYARQHCREGDYPGGLCWVRAREDVGTQIISFVRSCLELIPPDDLELVEKVRWCWGRWHEEAALLVFDDVQQYDDVAPFLPPQESRFQVLLTTRSHFGSPVQSLPLEVLSEAKALELLWAIVNQNRDTQDSRLLQEVGDLEQQLCQWLGCLPLGVELVGRYLARKPDLSLAVLWQRLQEKRLDAIAFKQAEPGMTASLGVAAAFELSWQALDESAQQVAAVLSLFALVEIPWTLVEQCLPTLDAEELEEIRDEQLLGTHLLKRVEQGMYQLHQLLREFFAAKRSQRADDSALQQTFYDVVIAEAKRVQEKPERSLIKESTVMIAHLQAAIDRAVSASDEVDTAHGSLWLAHLYDLQGRYSEAEPLYIHALAVWEQDLGADHTDVATILSSLAGIYLFQGRYSEAESLDTRALTIREEKLGANHPAVASSLNALAELYRAQRRYSEAEQFYTRALTLLEPELETEHPDGAGNLCTLANLYRFQGRYSEAEPLYLKALAIYKQQLGADHLNVNVGNTLNVLAQLYHSQGRYEEAEPHYINALTIREQQLGANHSLVATSFNNLGGLYDSQGRYEEAEPHYTRALAISEQQLGANHPFVAERLTILAEIYRKQGRYAEAEPLYERALTIWEQQLGFDHIGFATTLRNLAELYKSQARYGQAEPLLRRALSILQKQFPSERSSMAIVLSNLAQNHDLQGRYREAERLYLQALPIFSTKLEANHRWIQEGSQNFRALLQKAIQEQRTDELSDNPMTQGVLRELEEGMRNEG